MRDGATHSVTYSENRLGHGRFLPSRRKNRKRASKTSAELRLSQLSRRSRAQQLAQDQAQVEGADMDQLPLQDVLLSAQVATP